MLDGIIEISKNLVKLHLSDSLEKFISSTLQSLNVSLPVPIMPQVLEFSRTCGIR